MKEHHRGVVDPASRADSESTNAAADTVSRLFAYIQMRGEKVVYQSGTMTGPVSTTWGGGAFCEKSRTINQYKE